MNDFVVVGNTNAVTYKEVFPLIKDGKVRLGYCANKTVEYQLPEQYEKWDRIEDGKKYGKVPAVSWFTTFPVKKRPLILSKTYDPDKYPHYDNYDAIEVSRVNDIPKDYDGAMGVPISYLGKHNPKQFEILGIACGNSWANYTDFLKSLNFNPEIKYGGGLGSTVLGGKGLYARILIRKVKELPTEEEVKNIAE